MCQTARFELASLQKLVATSYYGETLWFTFWQAAVSTLLTVGLALPGAYVFANYQFKGKQSLQAMSTLPFVLPTVVVANAFTALLGPRGLLNGWLMGWLQFGIATDCTESYDLDDFVGACFL